ncbi:MAG TPA: SxtJ family membrane protein [Pirellulales bacterium]|jgi:hypothetical protein|nr:SxtJ family membrane protein [Pirellulales bacterium]
MRFADIDFHPTSKTLRQFAGLWIVFFAGMGAWQAWAHDRTTLGAVLGILAVTVGPLGLARPQWIKPIFVGWMVAVFPIGWLVSRVVLSLVFFALFTPIAILFRLSGRDPLRLRRKPAGQSYWHPKPMSTSPASYFRQF